MSAPLIVVILVATADAHAPESLAMTATTQDVLGPNAIVVVRRVDQLPTDEEATRLEGVLHADAVVEVTWPEPDHKRAHVHVHLSRGDTWSDRELTFAASDAMEERGRTVGFAVASMIPFPPAAPPVPTTPPAPPVAPPAPVKPTPSPARFVEADLVALASRGIGGYAGGVGGELSARLLLSDRFRLRIGTGVRLGEVPPARNASALALRVDSGVALRAWTSDGKQPFSLGVRVDFLIIRHALSLQTPDEQVSRDGRWIPGADGVLELSWAPVPDAAVVAGVGTEVAFGTTKVFVAGAEAAVIPRTRLIFELGLRARF